VIEVVCGLIESDGRILIGQRRPGDKHALKWEFPGGKVESGETPEQALARELMEELRVTAGAITEMHRYEFAYPGKAPVRLIFLHVAGFTGGVANQIYHALAWIAPAQLRDYDILEGDLAFIDWLRTSNWFRA
jgi:8-oxo-dGTP diphosphatase